MYFQNIHQNEQNLLPLNENNHAIEPHTFLLVANVLPKKTQNLPEHNADAHSATFRRRCVNLQLFDAPTEAGTTHQIRPPRES